MLCNLECVLIFITSLSEDQLVSDLKSLKDEGDNWRGKGGKHAAKQEYREQQIAKNEAWTVKSKRCLLTRNFLIVCEELERVLRILEKARYQKCVAVFFSHLNYPIGANPYSI